VDSVLLTGARAGDGVGGIVGMAESISIGGECVVGKAKGTTVGTSVGPAVDGNGDELGDATSVSMGIALGAEVGVEVGPSGIGKVDNNDRIAFGGCSDVDGTMGLIGVAPMRAFPGVIDVESTCRRGKWPDEMESARLFSLLCISGESISRLRIFFFAYWQLSSSGSSGMSTRLVWMVLSFTTPRIRPK
jgi:hypothetical protein